MARNRQLGRASALATAALVAGAFLFGAGSAAAGQTTKWTVCHHDKTLATWSPISVSTNGKDVHLAKGDYLADLRLVNQSVYFTAWTNIDGFPGYSICDKLNGAIYEGSGDSSVGAGDTIILGDIPTGFTAPFTFVSVGAISATVDTIRFCSTGGLGLNTTAGGIVVFRSNVDLFSYAPDAAVLDFGYSGQDSRETGAGIDVLQLGDPSTATFRLDDVDDGFLDTLNNSGC